MVFYILLLQFYFKKSEKEKKKMIYSAEKNRRKTKLPRYDICRWKRDSFSSAVEITRDVVLFEKTY